jgi:acetyl-CoA carboxylase beta subunit
VWAPLSPSARASASRSSPTPGTFDEEDGDLRSADPLEFFDLRPYVERLAEAELGTGLGDAILTGRAAVEGHPCRVAAMDFAFMGGLDGKRRRRAVRPGLRAGGRGERRA